MKYTQAYTSVRRAISHQQSVLMVGEPGIGKTSLAKCLANELGMDLVVSTPSLWDPTDARGLPFPDHQNGKTVVLPFAQMHSLIHATRPVLWLVDDIGQATPTVQAALMPWLLERQNEGMKLSDHVHIVAATNDRKHRAGVQGLLEPVKSRFTKIITLEACYKHWRTHFAIPSGVHPYVLAFLDFNDLNKTGNKAFNDFQPTADLTNSPSPRTWANASKILNDAEKDGVLAEAFDVDSVLFHDVSGSVGAKIAGELWSFIKKSEELPKSIDEVFTSPDQCAIPKSLETKFILVTSIVRSCTLEKLGGAVQFAKRLYKENEEIGSALIRSLFLRKELVNSKEFIEMSTHREYSKIFHGCGVARA
ncbi:ATP-binding protein [Flavobacterium sp.]|uniref:ATP-binding protein n=1 Tax=Flavobacterium sp. TaxID=239 RepID=UPI002638A4AF|nr:ATP-binding protein [Flavobacterium sp.]